MKHNIISSIHNIVRTGSENKMHDLVKLLATCIVSSYVIKECLFMDLRIIENGFHFNEHYLNTALECIGGKKLSCDEIISRFKSSGIVFPEDITKEDISYTYHMFLSDYGKASISDSTLMRLVQCYILDEDYPVKHGKAFAEWKLKHKLYKKI